MLITSLLRLTTGALADLAHILIFPLTASLKLPTPPRSQAIFVRAVIALALGDQTLVVERIEVRIQAACGHLKRDAHAPVRSVPC